MSSSAGGGTVAYRYKESRTCLGFEAWAAGARSAPAGQASAAKPLGRVGLEWPARPVHFTNRIAT